MSKIARNAFQWSAFLATSNQLVSLKKEPTWFSTEIWNINESHKVLQLYFQKIGELLQCTKSIIDELKRNVHTKQYFWRICCSTPQNEKTLHRNGIVFVIIFIFSLLNWRMKAEINFVKRLIKMNKNRAFDHLDVGTSLLLSYLPI